MSFLSYCNESIINESINDRGIFKAVVMAGIPGSGKSYLINQIKSGSIEPKVVNVDRFTEFLNIHDIMSVYDRSKQLTKNQLVQYLNGMLPLFIDTTGGNTERLKIRLNILDQIGYDYAMVFVNTSLETSLERASKRERKVEPDVIKKYYEKLEKYKSDVKGYFSFSIEINNDKDELTDEVINKAFNRISYFYDSQIENPIGQERYDLMRENGWKYLSPDVISLYSIKTLVNNWF
jgi:predicted kinase